MRFATLAVLLSGLGALNVVAAPTSPMADKTLPKFIITEHHIARLPFRVGLAGAPGAPIQTWTAGSGPRRRIGCANRLKDKAVAVSNKLRIIVGLPQIEAFHKDAMAPHGGHHGHNVHHTHGDHDKHLASGAHPHHHMHHRHRPGFRHHFRESTFVHRLTFALMALGKWEGRAVAFVLGCGLGVLLRMVWVFAVLLSRSRRDSTETEADFEGQYIVVEEESLLQPPSYTTAEEEKAAQADK